MTRRGQALLAHDSVLSEIIHVLESARRASARTVNAVMSATYSEIGRRIGELEQGGRKKTDYGDRLMEQLSRNLTPKFVRGGGRRNLFQVRAFTWLTLILCRRCLHH
jgi:hypothetical protein